METIKSIISAFKAPKKVRANQATTRNIIKKWHTSNLKKTKAAKLVNLQKDNKGVLDAFHKSVQPKQTYVNTGKWKGHPNIKYVGK